MSYIIGSFNIQNFNLNDTYRDRNSNKRDFYNIAGIILEEKYDIVALQEVMKKEAVDELIRIINRKSFMQKWNCYCKIPPLNGNRKKGEEPLGFAFLWNTHKFNLAKDTDGNLAEPKILKKYSGKIKRTPYYARFTPTNLPKVEIRLINIHLCSSGNGIEKQRDEFNLVTNQIYDAVECDAPGTNMDVYSVVLGDYNLCLTKSPKIKYDKSDFYITQDKPTTINGHGKVPHDGYTQNDYDHFSYNGKVKAYVTLSDRVDAVNRYVKINSEEYKNIFDQYYHTISDHVPIKLEINLKGN